MVGDDEALDDAPRSVREFFESCADPPGWVDLPSLLPGCRMFHRNTRLVLAGMLGHADAGMTLRYAHLGDREFEAAAERVSRSEP